jgi:hypothetical protein
VRQAQNWYNLSINNLKNLIMSVNNKHLATFLLGAAAAFGAYKYLNMTDEEKEKLATDLKDKATKLKSQALDAEDKAVEYFNELKTKGGDALKEHMPKIEEFINNLFKGGKSGADQAASPGSTPGTGTV